MIRSLVLAAVAVLLTISAAVAGDVWYYDHNGSVVALEWDDDGGDGFTIYYVDPKPGLPNYVGYGTVLFEGASPANGSIYGTAHSFSSKCGTSNYEVNGHFIGEGRDIYLAGPAPILNEKTCRDIRLSMDSRNARLRFNYLDY